MKTTPILGIAAGLLLSVFAPAFAQEEKTVRVQFKPGADSATLTGKIQGRESILYKLNAKKDQFLTVSLRPDNRSANYNIYIPGRGPGDEALYVSEVGGHEYKGQLYVSGDHTISVFLNRAAARRGEVANFDIVFRVTSDAPAAPPTDDPELAPAPDREQGWNRVTMVERAHGPLLARQAESKDLAKSPLAIAVLSLEPDLVGVTTSVTADYDTMEEPSEATVTITEGGILDDDLLGVRHAVSLARNRNNEWRIVGYRHGELRRNHLK